MKIWKIKKKVLNVKTYGFNLFRSSLNIILFPFIAFILWEVSILDNHSTRWRFRFHMAADATGRVATAENLGYFHHIRFVILEISLIWIFMAKLFSFVSFLMTIVASDHSLNNPMEDKHHNFRVSHSNSNSPTHHLTITLSLLWIGCHTITVIRQNYIGIN